MANKIYKLGELIEPFNEKCDIPNLSQFDVSGINRDKEFFEPSHSVGADTSNYKIVPPNYFACNLMHVGRDMVLPLAMNHTEKNKYVSPAYNVFKITRKDIVLKKYFMMMLKSSSKDKLFWFKADASVRDGLSWADMCDIEITLPSLEIQQKFVSIYEALLENLQSFRQGLDDLKLVCDGYIENLRKNLPCEKIGKYLRACNEKNENNEITLFQGVTVEHVFTDPKRIAENSENGSVVRKGQFAFNKVMKANGTKLPIALREDDDCVVSNSYQVFEISEKEKLNPKYLMLWFNRAETERYAGYISFGTTREIFSFDDLCEVSIPIPSIEIQKSIAEIYNAYSERKQIAERLNEQIKQICPVLIKGSLA